MPIKSIEPIMLAPCGMNCMVCYKHCYTKKACDGCLNSDTGKPEHCRKCKIKECVKVKGHTYCHECSKYPCTQTKALEKSYNTRYNTSLIENSLFAREYGLHKFMEKQKERYSCVHCGGVISLHDAECTECKNKVK